MEAPQLNTGGFVLTEAFARTVSALDEGLEREPEKPRSTPFSSSLLVQAAAAQTGGISDIGFEEEGRILSRGYDPGLQRRRRNLPRQTEPMHLFPMPRLLPTAITFLLGMASVFPANAAPKDGNNHQNNTLVKEYLELDANGDGKITEAEVLTDRSEKFKKIDADGDGAITLEEVRMIFEAEIPNEATESLRQRGIDDLSILFIDSMDANDDGQIDLVEFQRPARERFRQIDANSDGFATPGETTVFFSKIRF